MTLARPWSTSWCTRDLVSSKARTPRSSRSSLIARPSRRRSPKLLTAHVESLHEAHPADFDSPRTGWPSKEETKTETWKNTQENDGPVALFPRKIFKPALCWSGREKKGAKNPGKTHVCWVTLDPLFLLRGCSAQEHIFPPLTSRFEPTENGLFAYEKAEEMERVSTEFFPPLGARCSCSPRSWNIPRARETIRKP